MIAKLEFDLRDETDDFKMAVRGSDYWNVLWDLSVWIREKLKYDPEYKTADEALEAMQAKLYELIDDHNCPIDDIA